MAEKPSDTQQAMTRVLRAERDAEQAVTACEQDAREIIDAAQLRASRIADRTDERITLMKMRASQRITGEIKRREREEKRAQAQQAVELDDSGLHDCIIDVARVLTEGDPE